MNVTTNSFYSSSRVDVQDIVSRASEMIADGADILDIGGQSTRPGAAEIDLDEETNKVAKAILAVRRVFPEVLISVDTFRSAVAKAAMDNGCDIINDISGGNRDPKIWQIAQKYGAPYVLMHSRGNSESMMRLNNYQNLTHDIIKELSEKLFTLRMMGLNDVIVDPGFGFAKNINQNFELLNKLENFNVFELPILVGISRKSMVYKSLGINPEDGLNGTIGLNMLALQQGASILRVHDVKAAQQTIDMWMKYNG